VSSSAKKKKKGINLPFKKKETEKREERKGRENVTGEMTG
jgi:hypothetical protein